MMDFSKGPIGALPREVNQELNDRRSSSTTFSISVPGASAGILGGNETVSRFSSDMREKYQMRIEQANHDDADALEQIGKIEDAVFFDNALGEGTLRAEVRVGYCAVLREGPEVRGFALVRPHPELHDLLRLGVMPGFQGRGYGSWLLEHVLARYPGPMMLMVRKDNAHAKHLYVKNGFRTVGTTDQSWVMRRDYIRDDVNLLPQAPHT